SASIRSESHSVVPAKAGTQSCRSVARPWIPAFAGMTVNGLIRSDMSATITLAASRRPREATARVRRSSWITRCSRRICWWLLDAYRVALPGIGTVPLRSEAFVRLQAAEMRVPGKYEKQDGDDNHRGDAGDIPSAGRHPGPVHWLTKSGIITFCPRRGQIKP